jgi:hypothetical protein
MKRISTLLSAILLTSCTFLAFGQNNDDAFRAYIKDVYMTRINTMSDTRDIGPVLEAFDPQYQGRAIDVSVDGKLNIRAVDHASLKQQLKNYTDRPGMDISMSVPDNFYVQTNGATGVAGFVLDIKVISNGEVMSEGSTLMEVIARKRHDGYKIVYSSAANVDEVTYSGPCFVDTYSKGSNSFLTQLSYPTGRTYKTETYSFQIGERGEKRWIRVNDGEYFYDWTKGVGDIKSGEKVLGQTLNQSTAIKIILKELSMGKCTVVQPNK